MVLNQFFKPKEKILNLKRSVYGKILLYLLVPAFLVILMLISSYYFLYNKIMQLTIQKCEDSLEVISESTDNIIFSAIKSINYLALNKDFNDAVLTYSIKENAPTDRIKLYNAIECLSTYTATSDMVLNSFIVFEENDIIIHNKGASGRNMFFESENKYDRYSLNDFISKAKSFKNYSVLKPSFVSLNGNLLSSVIPVIVSDIVGYNAHSFIVLNIKQENINQILKRFFITPGTYFLVIDKYNNIYASNKADIQDKIMGTDLYNFVDENSNSTIITLKLDGNEYLVKSYFSKYNILSDIIYVALVPKSDILVSIKTPRIIFIVTSIMSLLISIFLSIILSKKLYSPIYNLLNIFKSNVSFLKTTIFSRDEFDFLKNGIFEVITDKEKIYSDLSTAIPAAAEYYLKKIILSDEVTEFTSEQYQCIERYGISFPHEYFCFCRIKLIFTEKYYSTYNIYDRNTIYNGILRLLKSSFQNTHVVYVSTLESGYFDVIINIETTEEYEKIINIIKTFIGFFSNDYQMVKLFCGIGNVYKGFTGLKKSYEEAQKVIINIQNDGYGNIRIYDCNKDKNAFSCPVYVLNKIFNFLCSSKYDNAKEIFYNVIKENISANIDNKDLKNLYFELYKTGLRVVARHSVSLNLIMGESIIPNFENEYMLLMTEELENYILLFYRNICKYLSTKNKSINIVEVISYINESFSKEISLNYIANKYNTSSSHLSQLIKEYLNMSYIDYLNNLRIEKAKKLLVETKKNIDQIAEECGYNSRQSFLRVFNKLEGIAPTEYRTNNKNVKIYS